MKKLILLSTMLAGAMLAQDSAHIRVVHASPDAPAVDVLVNGSKVLEAIPFKEYSEYLAVPAGRYDIRVNVSGTNTTVLQASPELAAGQDYTAMAVGKVANIELLLIADDNSSPEDGNARLRVIHAAPSAPSVDVYATSPFEALASKTPALSNVPFKAVSGYLEVPAGNYQARVAVANTKTVAIDSGRIPKVNGAVRTIIAIENATGSTPFGFLILNDKN